MDIRNLGKNIYDLQPRNEFIDVGETPTLITSFSDSTSFQANKNYYNPRDKKFKLATIFETSNDFMSEKIIPNVATNFDYFQDSNQFNDRLKINTEKVDYPKLDAFFSVDNLKFPPLNIANYVAKKRNNNGETEFQNILQPQTNFTNVGEYSPYQPDLQAFREDLVKDNKTFLQNIFQNSKTEYDDLNNFFDSLNKIIVSEIKNFLNYLDSFSNVKMNETLINAIKQQIDGYIEKVGWDYHKKVNEFSTQIANLKIQNEKINSFKHLFKTRALENLDWVQNILHALGDMKISNLLLLLAKDKILYQMADRNKKLYDEINDFKNNTNAFGNSEEHEKLLRAIEEKDLKIKRLNDEIENSNRILVEQKFGFDEILRAKVSVEAENARLMIDNEKMKTDFQTRINQLKVENENIRKMYAQLSPGIGFAAEEKKKYMEAFEKNEKEIQRLNTQLFQQTQLANVQRTQLAEQLNEAKREKEIAIQKFHENTQQMESLALENEKLRMVTGVNLEPFQELLNTLGINPRSENFNEEFQNAVTELFRIYNEISKIEKGKYGVNDYNNKIAIENEKLKREYGEAQNKIIFLQEQIQNGKLKLNQMKTQQMDLEIANNISNNYNEDMNRLSKTWPSSLSALTIAINEASERVNLYYNDWISPFYNFFSKRNAILKLVQENYRYFDANKAINFQIPRSEFQFKFPHSPIASFYQIYFTALIKNLEIYTKILIYRYNTWYTEAAFNEDPFANEKEMLTGFTSEVSKYDAIYNTNLRNLKNDDIFKQKNALDFCVQKTKSFLRSCYHLQEAIKANEIKIKFTKEKLHTFIIANPPEKKNTFNNIVLNLYQLYLNCSSLNSLYHNFGYTYFNELFEIILISQRLSGDTKTSPAEILTQKNNSNYSISIEEVDFNTLVSNKKLQEISYDLFPISNLQLTISPVSVVAKIKLMLRNYMISLNYGLTKQGFSHNFNDCLLLDLFFWRMKKNESLNSTQSCEKRIPSFFLYSKTNIPYLLADLDENIINDCFSNLTKAKVLFYFYELISRTLLWMIQKIQMEIYFSLPNSFEIYALKKNIEEGMMVDNVYLTLKSFKSAHIKILNMVSLGILNKNGINSYTPFQEDRSLVCKFIAAHLRNEPVILDIVEDRRQDSVANEFIDLITTEQQYAPGDYLIWGTKRASKPVFLPVINFVCFIKANGLKEHSNAIELLSIQQKSLKEIPNERFPYEYLMDDADTRLIESAKSTYDQNRKFLYFLAFNYLFAFNMKKYFGTNLDDVARTNPAAKQDIAQVYKNLKVKDNAIPSFKNKLLTSAETQDFISTVHTQKIITTILAEELLKNNLKIKLIDKLPNLQHDELLQKFEEYLNGEKEYENNKFTMNLITGNEIAKNADRNFNIINCEKVNSQNENLSTDLWGILTNKLTGYKKNITTYTLKPILEFAAEIKKYLKDDYLV